MEEILEELSRDLMFMCLSDEETFPWLITKVANYDAMFDESTKDFDFYRDENPLFSLASGIVNDLLTEDEIHNKIDELCNDDIIFETIMTRHKLQSTKAYYIKEEIKESFEKYPLGRSNLDFSVEPKIQDISEVDEPYENCIFQPVVGEFRFPDNSLVESTFGFANLNNDFSVVEPEFDEEAYLLFKEKYFFSIVGLDDI